MSDDYRLTPEDVRGKQFSTTRLRPGYDETEVDAFLDLIESEVSLLHRERDAAHGLVDELRRVLPENENVTDLATTVSAVYRLIWGEPHPGSAGLS
ncbi:DivIVA domain-containing protein [Actinomadura atramentaria]|uniref:DivIVA domain-containing protein n=1 Tax=Actinomadura atramentaria TaxID=1990 RepID=UPI0003A800A9|nr:DivIVA domain-containing protein [Actinomadura atramentaria]